MEAILEGSSPGATTAAILLMSRARQLGYPLRVHIAGNPDDISPVYGPAVVHSPVLASCGVGRSFGHGGTVVIPGLDDAPLMLSLQTGGTSEWFEISRSGPGHHAATQAFYRMSRDPRVEARKLAKQIRHTFEALGLAPKTGFLDFLFHAPIPPLTRIALTLRAGRSVHTGVSQPVTQFFSGQGAQVESSSSEEVEDIQAFLQATINNPSWMGLNDTATEHVLQWCALASTASSQDNGRDGALIIELAGLIQHLAQLPAHSILPPLDSTLDGVALCLPKALEAVGNEDANQSLRQMFTFLGGRYVEPAPNMHQVYVVDAPDAPLQRWQWFCEAAMEGRRRADELWPLITDPPS